MICRNRFKLCIFIAFLSTFHLNVRQVDSFSSQRQRYASRMLKITPKACTSPTDPSVTGICMISLECQQRSGTVIGACRDGHLFGACCHDPTPAQNGSPAEISSTSTTTTTTTTTTTEPTTTTTTTTEPPPILNNEINPSGSEERLLPLQDTTGIPSLLDTFSELSPTFLSELALDEHTTGMYASLPSVTGASLLRDSIKETVMNDEEDETGSSSAAAPSSTENSVYPSSTYHTLPPSTTVRSTTEVIYTVPSSSSSPVVSQSTDASPPSDIPVLPSSSPTMPVNKWRNPFWPLKYYSTSSTTLPSSSSYPSSYPTQASMYSTSHSTSSSSQNTYYPSSQSTSTLSQNTYYPSSQSTYQSETSYPSSYQTSQQTYPSSQPTYAYSPFQTSESQTYSTSSESKAPATQSTESTQQYPSDATYYPSEIAYSSSEPNYIQSSSETPTTYYYYSGGYPSTQTAYSLSSYAPSTSNEPSSYGYYADYPASYFQSPAAAYYSSSSSSSDYPSYSSSSKPASTIGSEAPTSLPLASSPRSTFSDTTSDPEGASTTYYTESSSSTLQPSPSSYYASSSPSLPTSSVSEVPPEYEALFSETFPTSSSYSSSSSTSGAPEVSSTDAASSSPTFPPSSTSYSSSQPSVPSSTSPESPAPTKPTSQSSSSSTFPSSSSSVMTTTTEKQEIGGLAALGQDPSEFKDNMIKFIDDIVTMRTNEITPIEDEPSAPSNDFNELPFSTFTIVSSTKSTETASPVTWTWSTTGLGNTDEPTTFKYNIVSTGETNLPPSRTTSSQNTSSEEVLSVSVAHTVGPLATSTETNDLTSPDSLSTIPQTSESSVEPTKFTFSKLKYTPRPYKQRPPTTRKIVWTRPTTTTTEPAWEKPVDIAEDEEEDEDNEEDNLVSGPSGPSSSQLPSSTEQTTMTMTTSTEASSSSMPVEDDIEGHYDPTTIDYPSSLFTSSPASTTAFGIDWASPTILSIIKGATENLEKIYYGNVSRSDFVGISGSANDITAPSSTTGPSGPSTTSLEDMIISNIPTSSSTTTWKTTSGLASSSTERSTERITSPGSSSAPSGPSPSSSSWDTSIDSFVDQVVEGIVHDLNKNNNNKKIDDMIFNKKKNKTAVVSKTNTTSPITKQADSDKRTIIPTVPANVRLTSFKSKYSTSAAPVSSTEKTTKVSKVKAKPKPVKVKTTKRPLLKTTTSSEAPVSSTTSKERLKQKIKVKVPATNAKTRTNKIKTKPVKKVTTAAKTQNSTRKRLNFKRDCGVRPLIKSGRIVGGTPSRFGSWPWHALVKETVWWGIFSKIKCGGVLIGAQHVLTAAHCQPQQTGTLSVVLGITDSDDSRAITKTVRRIIPHPHFNPRTYENDIAILELDSPIDFQPHIVPICLPRKDDEFEGKDAYVTGMGLLKHDGERPLVLQEVDLPILNNTECQKMFVRSGNKKPIIESFICAGYEQGRKDSCGGDSGGPLSVKRTNGQWVLAGTVSHGIKCALPDQPGVYMRTSYYKPWIDRVLSVARSRYRGIPRCNAPPLICARQRHNQQRDSGIVHTIFRIFRLARKMVDEGNKRSSSGSS